MIVEEERDFILFKKNAHNQCIVYIKKDSNQKRSNYLDEGKPVKE